MEIKTSKPVDKGKKRLFKNWYYLTVLQIAQFVVPFIPIPYLARVLPPDKFGLVAFAVAMSQLFAVFVEYGFSYSAVKGIAIFKKDPAKVCEIYSCAVIIKALIAVLLTGIFALCLFFIPQIAKEKKLFIFAFLMIYSDVFFTAWFFQGYERMKYMAWLTLIMETLYVVLVFVFVRSAGDYIYVPLLDAVCYFVIGVASIIIIYKKFGIPFRLQPAGRIIFHFKRGWHYFISDFASNAYSSASVFILGFIASSSAVGYYRAALSVLIPVKALFEPIIQAAYPYISKTAVEDKSRVLHFLKTYSFSVAAAAFAVSAILFLSSDLIVKIFLGAQYQNSSLILKIFSPVPFLYALNMIFALHIMYPFGMKANFAKTTAWSAIISFALIPVLAVIFKSAGMAAIMVIGELFISAVCYAKIRKTINVPKNV
jgi:PST family polysaccharide transporter